MLNNLFSGIPSAKTKTDDGFAQMAQNVMQFANQYKGDPYAEAQAMIRSGKITQQQWDQALNMARQIIPYLPK